MSHKKKKRKIGFFIVIAILVLIIGIVIVFRVFKPQSLTGNSAIVRLGPPIEGGGPPLDTLPPEQEEATYAVKVLPAVLGPISEYFTTNGEVVARHAVDTYAEVGGFLVKSDIEVGDYVRQGSILAQVDPSRPGGAIYALSPIKARKSGTITAIYLKKGDLVTLQTPLATISELSNLQVRIQVPERFVSKVSLGMPAELSLEAYPEQVISLKVNQISPVLDPISRSMEAILDIAPNEDKIKAGMYAKIKLTTEKKEEVIKIPIDCIIRRLGETFVFIVGDDALAEKRLVLPGIVHNNMVEIIQGLKEGDQVIYQGQNLLENGAKIEVFNENSGT